MRPKLVTPEVLDRVKLVIAATDVPSWVSSVPHNYGDAAAGTLKADEWRTLGTIYIPIALTSLWGADDPIANASAQQVPAHKMLLVSAAILAMKDTITMERMAAYRENIMAYIEGILDLYPGVNVRTNHHVEVHIYDFLQLFGPVKSWWCFPFERLIGYLQLLNHNHTSGRPFCMILWTLLIVSNGETENTLLKASIESANLRRWITREDGPETILHCRKYF